jgi:hypothetical protein
MQRSTWFYSRVGVAQFASQLITHYLASVRMPDESCRLRQSGPASRSRTTPTAERPVLWVGYSVQLSSCMGAGRGVCACVRVTCARTLEPV